jgi:hypothetical protein
MATVGDVDVSVSESWARLPGWYAVAGTAVFALGVCLVCIVPVAEVDLDTKLAGMPRSFRPNWSLNVAVRLSSRPRLTRHPP